MIEPTPRYYYTQYRVPHLLPIAVTCILIILLHVCNFAYIGHTYCELDGYPRSNLVTNIMNLNDRPQECLENLRETEMYYACIEMCT